MREKRLIAVSSAEKAGFAHKARELSIKTAQMIDKFKTPLSGVIFVPSDLGSGGQHPRKQRGQIGFGLVKDLVGVFAQDGADLHVKVRIVLGQ